MRIRAIEQNDKQNEGSSAENLIKRLNR